MATHIHNTIYKVSQASGSGTAFYLKDHDLFVTNYHVVEGAHWVALLDDEGNAMLAHVILVNPSEDVALLRTEVDCSHLPALEIASSDGLSHGDKVHVAGYPYGLPFSVTEGTVSSPKQLMGGRHYIQTDAAVNPGNSGGPIFNSQWQVVGITVCKFSDADNMGFGIRTDVLLRILEQAGDLGLGYKVQCHSCEGIISEPSKYCPNCGAELPKKIFEEQELSPLAKFCESAIEAMDYNPILARGGYEQWSFYIGSSLIHIFPDADEGVLAIQSPINTLPKSQVEPLLDYLLSTDLTPYKLWVRDSNIYLGYSTHLTEISEENEESIRGEMVRMAEMAGEMAEMFVEQFGCDYSIFTKFQDEEATDVADEEMDLAQNLLEQFGNMLTDEGQMAQLTEKLAGTFLQQLGIDPSAFTQSQDKATGTPTDE